ncbi:hypothetical protein [Mycobacterium sp. 29Ha]|uniref:hypothetical protein n=1 Tax=Mycobacterium sp. 29Ha TaxID=2939268 RepID=UPI002938DA8C|nr:hypothetical protein [Mycobacterium sp. 29Ha]MDV3133325.1 hypothetical protein [Mycobacterium sp. 29Ha]
MSDRNASPSAPPSWAATQQWLDELDQDAPARPSPRDEHGWPAEPDYDAEPTELDVIDDDEPPADEHLNDGAYEQPTVPLGNAAEQATVKLDNAFGRDYTPAGPGDGDDAPSGPAYFDDADDADLYDTEPTDLAGAVVGAPDVLDAHHDSAHSTATGNEPAEPPRFNRAVAAGFIGATVVAIVIVTTALLAMRSSPQPAAEQASPTTQISVAAAPSAPPPPDAGADTPIPYTPSAPGCLPGSSAAQAVAGTDPTQAWVCVRNGVDGQILQIDLGRPMVVTAISITPGWVGADATGADQWLQHRVLTRVQWNLFNGNDTPTVVRQKTGNVRGEAAQPMPNGGVLVSRITMIVQETARAPADTAPPTTGPDAPGGGGGLLDDVLGAPLGPPPSPTSDPGPPLATGLPGERSASDPADNTFAVSSIKILGHPPR